MPSLTVLSVFILVLSVQLATVSAGCHFDQTKSEATCISVESDEFVYFTKQMCNDFRLRDDKFDFFIEDVDMPNEYLIKTISCTSRHLNKLRIANDLSSSDAKLLYTLNSYDIHLDLSNNSLHDFPNTCPEPFSTLIFRQNPINFLKGTDRCYAQISVVDLSQCNISHIDTEAFHLAPGIADLNLSRNAIKSLNFSLRNFHLDVLDLSYNKLEYLNSSEFGDVRILYLQNNGLLATTFNFTTYPFARDILYISVDKLGNMNDSLINLRIEYGYYSYHRIEEIDVISTEEHVIPSYAFTPPSNYYTYSLLSINIRNANVCRLSRDAFGGLGHVDVLNINYNNISKLENLTFRSSSFSSVDLSFSQIRTVESQAFANASIHTVILNYNILIEIQLDAFHNITEVDLSHNMIHVVHASTTRSDIQKLHLQFNNLSSADYLGSFQRLVHLNLSSNAIESVACTFARGLGNLVVLDLSNNLLTKLSDKVFWPLVSLEWLSLEKNRFIKFNSAAFSYDSHKLKSIGFSLNGSITKNQFVRFQSLTSLNITDSWIRVLQSGSFNRLYSLNSIVTRNVTVESVEPNAFVDLYRLTDVDFSVLLKYMTVLEKGTFKGFIFLKNVVITYTNVTNLTCEAFSGLKDLIFLNISHNKVKMVAIGAFKDLQHLESLILSHNALEYVGPGMFDGLKALTSLDLSHNKINILTIGGFKDLENLKSLILSHNALEYVGLEMFGGLKELTSLDVSHNNLQRCGATTVFPLTSLVHLNISHNRILELDDYETLKASNELFRGIVLNSNAFECAYVSKMLKYFRHNNIDYDSNNFTSSNIDGVACRLRYNPPFY